jgi:hypothetical protein
MSGLSYDLPQVLLLDCAGLVSTLRVREAERQGLRVLRVSDPCEALEHLMLRRFDALWIALAEGERAGVLLVEELERDPLLTRLPIAVELERVSVARVAELRRCGVERVHPLGASMDVLLEAIGDAVPVGSAR